MPIICTLGYTQKSLEQFIRLLQQAGVDAVIDVRLRNTSQLAGFAKRDDLSFLLLEGFGIDYEHRPELAPTPQLFDEYKANGNWTTYRDAFLLLLAQRDAEAIGRQIVAEYQRPCLLCAEPLPDRCHRRLVAEFWAQHLPDLEIKHLI